MTEDRTAQSNNLYRVLIVDDEEHIRNALSRLLRRHEYEVATAINGDQGLKRLRRGERFDCVLLDLMMPVVSGRQVVEAMHAEELIELKRVIILTAVHNADNATAYLQYGCAGYIGKPFENEKVLEQIRRICEQNPPLDKLEAII